MKKIVLIVALIMLASCTGGPPDKDSGAFTPEQLNGPDGVVLSVLHQPDQIYEKEDFSLTFLLHNVGQTSINLSRPGWLSVNVDPLYINFISLDSKYSGDQDALHQQRKGSAYVPFALEQRYWYAEGEDTFVTLQGRAKPLQRFSEHIATRVSLNACYPYSSNITQDVCIETEHYEDPGSIACTNVALRPPPPGAPIALKEVTVRNLRRTPNDPLDASPGYVTPTFHFLIENVGPGTPGLGECVSLNADGTISDPVDRKLGMVEVSARLLTTPLECGQEDPGVPAQVRLIDGVGSLVCRVPATDGSVEFEMGQGNFISLLSVDIAYFYRDSITTELSIVHE